MRYKVWRSHKDRRLHLLCAEGAEAFEALPGAVRGMGPWTGGPEGAIDRLRLPFRVMLNQQGFAVIYAHPTQLELEISSGGLQDAQQIIRNALNATATAMYPSMAGCGGKRARGAGVAGGVRVTSER